MNAESVKARLKNFAVSSGCTFQDALVYYGLERTIYRLSVSPYASHFVLQRSCQAPRSYLTRIHCEKRRYYRDQLGVIRNLFDEWDAGLIQKALVYCTEQELYSAGDLSSAVAYISLLEEDKQNTTNGRCVRLPEKYRGGSPQIRDLCIYEKAMERRAVNG
jgi:hypothetical protein